MFAGVVPYTVIVGCVLLGAVVFMWRRDLAEVRAFEKRERERYFAIPESTRVVNMIIAAAVCRHRRIVHSYQPHIAALLMVRHLMSRLHHDMRALLIAGPRILSIVQGTEADAQRVLDQTEMPDVLAARWIDPPVERGTLRRLPADPALDA